MGRKESNQTKNQTVYFAEACENALFAFWQTPYYVWSVRSLNSRWNQILYQKRKSKWAKNGKANILEQIWDIWQRN